jgi:ribose-phosphate pyrophosphokinase
MKDRNCVLFAGNASEQLAKAIIACNQGITLGDIYHHKFPSGEWYCQLKENVRGADVFLLQALCEPANDNVMQLLVMADAARRASADRITAVIPYFGYQRQDRKDKPRVPISAKLIMNILEASGINRVITMDLHAQQIQGFTDLPVDHLYFQPTLAKALKSLNIQVVVAPDIGAVKKASEYAEKEKLDVAFIVKKRHNDINVEMSQFVGDVKGKNVLVLDDLTESAGTIIMASKTCKDNGAANIYAAVTHACISRIGVTRLNQAFKDGVVNRFFCSDTVSENSISDCTDGSIVSVAEVFAKAIKGTHCNESITSLFK